jgi:hypothetical protein
MTEKTEPDYDNKIAMTVHLKNRGKTPAYRARLDVFFEYGEKGFNKDKMTLTFIRKGREGFVSISESRPVLPDDGTEYSLPLSGPVLQQLNKYSERVVGLVTYFDLYEKEYHVNLCFETKPTPKQIYLWPCMERDANVSK